MGAKRTTLVSVQEGVSPYKFDAIYMDTTLLIQIQHWVLGMVFTNQASNDTESHISFQPLTYMRSFIQLI